MKIRTYRKPLISRRQSALYAVLAQGKEPIDNLGADHPAMTATCMACDELDRKMLKDNYLLLEDNIAEPVEISDRMRECARLYGGLLGVRLKRDRLGRYCVAD